MNELSLAAVPEPTATSSPAADAGSASVASLPPTPPPSTWRRRRGVARGLMALSLVFAAQGVKLAAVTHPPALATCDAIAETTDDALSAPEQAPARVVVEAGEGRPAWMSFALTPVAGLLGGGVARGAGTPAPDFSRPTAFQPVASWREARAGGLEFTITARPAYAEGALSEWLDRLCYAEGLDRGAITTTVVGGQPAVMCDAIGRGEPGLVGREVRRRLVLLEDGGRVFCLTIQAPQMFWAAGLARLEPMLRSFALTEVHGAQMALQPGEPTPAPVPAMAGDASEAGAPASS